VTATIGVCVVISNHSFFPVSETNNITITIIQLFSRHVYGNAQKVKIKNKRKISQ
jgi:hypothetical protein